MRCARLSPTDTLLGVFLVIVAFYLTWGLAPDSNAEDLSCMKQGDKGVTRVVGTIRVQAHMVPFRYTVTPGEEEGYD